MGNTLIPCIGRVVFQYGCGRIGSFPIERIRIKEEGKDEGMGLGPRGRIRAWWRVRPVSAGCGSLAPASPPSALIPDPSPSTLTHPLVLPLLLDPSPHAASTELYFAPERR